MLLMHRGWSIPSQRAWECPRLQELGMKEKTPCCGKKLKPETTISGLSLAGLLAGL